VAFFVVINEDLSSNLCKQKKTILRSNEAF
jgi:hypothetical protein